MDKQTRIMVFGTFDFLHPGHEYLFKQARKLAKNPFLIISVARDKNVLRIKSRLPKRNETTRVNQLKKVKLVDKVVLGGLRNHMPHIIKEKPDIIALGYDQFAYTKDLRKELNSVGLKTKIVRLKPHKPHIYKSSLLEKKSRQQ